MATCGNAKALECSLKVTYTYFVSAASHSICRAEIESERDPFSRFQGREDGAVFRRRRRRRGFFAVTPLLRSRAAELSIKEKEGGREEGRKATSSHAAGRPSTRQPTLPVQAGGIHEGLDRTRGGESATGSLKTSLEAYFFVCILLKWVRKLRRHFIVEQH